MQKITDFHCFSVFFRVLSEIHTPWGLVRVLETNFQKSATFGPLLGPLLGPILTTFRHFWHFGKNGHFLPKWLSFTVKPCIKEIQFLVRNGPLRNTTFDTTSGTTGPTLDQHWTNTEPYTGPYTGPYTETNSDKLRQTPTNFVILRQTSSFSGFWHISALFRILTLFGTFPDFPFVWPKDGFRTWPGPIPRSPTSDRPTRHTPLPGYHYPPCRVSAVTLPARWQANTGSPGFFGKQWPALNTKLSKTDTFLGPK